VPFFYVPAPVDRLTDKGIVSFLQLSCKKRGKQGNPKHEIRNTKQIIIFKNNKSQTAMALPSVGFKFWNIRI
jgi:hypothetical protein